MACGVWCLIEMLSEIYHGFGFVAVSKCFDLQNFTKTSKNTSPEKSVINKGDIDTKMVPCVYFNAG